MGLYDKFLDIFTEPVDDSKPKKSIMDIFFVDESKEARKKNGRSGSFMDIFFKPEQPENSFTDSSDVKEAFNTLSGTLQFYKERLDSLSTAVYSVDSSLDSLDKQKFAGAKDTILAYCELLEVFKEFEPYMYSQYEDLDSFRRTNIKVKLDNFEQKFSKIVPEAKTLCWFSETYKANLEMQRLFETGTMRDISLEKLSELEEYLTQIASQKGEFTGYKNQLVSELITAEYRLKTLQIMHEIGSGKEITKSPFADSGKARISQYSHLFLEDFDTFRKQYDNITGLKRIYIEEAKLYSKSFFDRLDYETDYVVSKLNKFLIGDYSVSEVFDSTGTGFETLKNFLAIKLKMNTMKSRYHQYIQSTPIPKKEKKQQKRTSQDDDFDIGD